RVAVADDLDVCVDVGGAAVDGEGCLGGRCRGGVGVVAEQELTVDGEDAGGGRGGRIPAQAELAGRAVGRRRAAVVVGNTQAVDVEGALVEGDEVGRCAAGGLEDADLHDVGQDVGGVPGQERSEERRVGKEWR